MFKKFGDIRSRIVFAPADGGDGVGDADADSGIDYGALLQDLYQEQAKTKFEAKEKVEPAKTDKEVAGY